MVPLFLPKASKELSNPKYIFDPRDPCTFDNTYQGLYESKRPYDLDDNDRPTEIKPILLAPKTHKNLLLDLYNDLKDGWGPYFGDYVERNYHGLKTLFSLADIPDDGKVIIEEVHNLDYIYSAEKLVENLKKYDYDPSIILIAIPEEQETTGITENTYYALKSIFSNYGIPTQMVTLSTLQRIAIDKKKYEKRTKRGADRSKQFWAFASAYIAILRNIAMAIYAKAGGVPWVLSDEIGNIDCFIGFSYSLEGWPKRTGRREVCVGCSHIFDRRGKWIGFEEASVQSSTIIENMQTVILKSLRRYRRWSEQVLLKAKLPKNLVIHKFGTFHKNEINAVQNAIEEIYEDSQDVDFSLVSIRKTNVPRVYDMQHSKKYVTRGTLLINNDRSGVLCTTGLIQNQSRTFIMGTPLPLFIDIEHSSNNANDEITNIENVARHIFWLTGIHWETMQRNIRLPATIKYSYLVARFIYQGVNPEPLRERRSIWWI